VTIAIAVDAGWPGNFATSPGPTVSITATAGQAVIVTGLVFSTLSSVALTGITDNAGGNTWVFSTSTAQSPPYQEYHLPSQSGYSVVFVGWCLSLTNPVTSVTISDNTGQTDFWRVSVSSWTGIVVADNGASNFYASTTAPSSTVSLGNAGDLVVGVANNDSSSFTGSPSGGSGWSEFTGAGSTDIGYIFPEASGNYTATWTLSGSDTAVTAIQAFSPAALGATVNLTAPNLALAAPLVTVQSSPVISLTTPNLALAAPLLTPETPAQKISLTTPNLALAAPRVTPPGHHGGQSASPLAALIAADLI
jgi:hypothetical protein